MIALQAQYSDASRRAAAESVLRDYSSLVADEVIRRSAADVGYYGYGPLVSALVPIPLVQCLQVVTIAGVAPGVSGVISKVENRKGSLTALALVRPYVNFTALGVVGIVIAPPAHDPRFSVLPPMPKPRPTPKHSPGPNASATPTPTPSASLTAGPNQAAGG